MYQEPERLIDFIEHIRAMRNAKNSHEVIKLMQDYAEADLARYKIENDRLLLGLRPKLELESNLKTLNEIRENDQRLGQIETKIQDKLVSLTILTESIKMALSDIDVRLRALENKNN